MSDSQQERPVWLANLKTGDRVIVDSHYMNRLHVRVVTDDDKKSVWIGTIRYDRKTGSSCGNGTRDKLFPATLEIPTPQKLREAEFSALLSLVRNVDWQSSSVASLRLVASALGLPHNDSLYSTQGD